MRSLIIFASLLLSAPVAAQTAPSPSPAATAGKLTIDSPIEALMADPASKAVVVKYMPTLADHPAYETIKSMSIKDVQPLSGGAITDAMVAGVDADLQKLPAKK